MQATDVQYRAVTSRPPIRNQVSSAKLPKTLRQAPPSQMVWHPSNHNQNGVTLSSSSDFEPPFYSLPLGPFVKEDVCTKAVDYVDDMSDTYADALINWHSRASDVGLRVLKTLEEVIVPHVIPPLPPNSGPRPPTTTVFTHTPVATKDEGVSRGVTTKHLCIEWSPEMVLVYMEAHAFKDRIIEMNGPYLRVRVGWKNVGGKRKGVYEYAHRLILLMLEGLPRIVAPLTTRMWNTVCHACNNKRCLNPNHMFFGTAYLNKRDESKIPQLFSELRAERARKLEQRRQRVANRLLANAAREERARLRAAKRDGPPP